MWVTLGSILNKLTDGTHKTPKYTSTGVKFVSVKDMSNGFLSLENTKYISEEEHKELYARCNPEKGDLILSKVGTTGVPAIVDTTEPFSLFVSVALLKFDCKCIDIKFLYYMLMSPLVQAQATENTRGVGNKNWVLDAIASTMVVLPPLVEQKRIVAKIEELLPLVDRYAASYEKLEQFNAKFPEDMKKSILQYAIQGKLVEQRPEEGTGEELYRQIQYEKQRLIKEGKIKKEKPLPEIAENEIPFDIPDSWKWVRIGQIFNLQAGKNITASDIYEEVSCEHRYLCYGGNGVRGYVSNFNREGHYALIGRQGALCGNINVAEGQFYATEHAVVVDHFNQTDVVWSAWFLKALNLNQYATATAQPGLAVANIVKVLIPLPPLAEQIRIVAKLEEILPLCERLK